jgi:hypothetical protein
MTQKRTKDNMTNSDIPNTRQNNKGAFLRSKTQAVGDLDQMHDILQSQHCICLQKSQVTQSKKKT